MENKKIECGLCLQYKNPYQDHDSTIENPENFIIWSNDWDGGYVHQECSDEQ